MSYSWPPPFYGYDNWLEDQSGANYAEDHEESMKKEVFDELDAILNKGAEDLGEKIADKLEEHGIYPSDELLDEIADQATEEIFRELERHMEDPEYHEFQKKRFNYHDD